jgi:dihydroorotate dehydrogenase
MNPYALAKPLLFKLDPETAHNLTMAGLRHAHRLGLLKPFLPRPSPPCPSG